MSPYARRFALAAAIAVSLAHARDPVTLTHVHGFSVFFDLDGKDLWFGTHDAVPRLSRTPVDPCASTRKALLALAGDAVAYIAQNTSARTEYAIATFQRNVYVSKDAARNWTPIAERRQVR